MKKWRIRVIIFVLSAPFALAQIYRYDDSGRVLSATYAGGQIVAYTYDSAGNLLTVTPTTTATDGSDLEIANLAVSPTAVVTPGFSSCSFNLINHGPLALNVASVLVSFYLSTDPALGGENDIKIGDASMTVSLGVGASSAVNFNATRLTNMVRLWPATQPAGGYYLMATVTLNGSAIDPNPSNNSVRGSSQIVYAPAGTPVIASPPASLSAAPGSAIVLTASGTGSPSPAYLWEQNGVAIPGATTPTLAIGDVQPGDAGIYTLNLSSGSAVVQSVPVILGVTSTAKIIGTGSEVGSNIVHPNGNVYDQILLQGPAASVTADYTLGQITRTSFIDLNDDIVQVEFAGPGTLTLVLDSWSGPALPIKYNQSVAYVKGHASIVITGANEYTNVSVFTVGRFTAVNQALFKSNVSYDGIADLAYIAIASTDGKFGGVRAADANFWAASGLTGVYAPGVQFVGPVYVGDITAFDSATPVLILGSVSDARITGGSLSQDNNEAVEVNGIAQLRFVDGSDSEGNLLTAQANQAVLEQNGQDVTAQIVVNPQ